MKCTADVSLPLNGGALGGAGVQHCLDPIFLGRFQKVLSASGTIFKFLSILGDNFFMFPVEPVK